MTRRSVPESRLVERSQLSSVVEPQLAGIAPLVRVGATVISEKNSSKEMEIRELAFQLYEQRGRKHGHDVEDWLEAEVILSQPKQAA